MNFVNAPTWIRYCACDASRPAPWPSLSAWLTDSEQTALAALRAPARQSGWLWGRWISKQLIGNATQTEDLREIEILTRGEQGLGISPRVKLAGRPWPVSLSISHVEKGVLVGLSLDEEISLGVDLACNVPSDQEFRSLWFTAKEQAWIADDPDYRTSLLWGFKEALFKACNFPNNGVVGETNYRWAPGQIEIEPTEQDSFQAVFFGTPLKRLDVHVQSVASGLAVVVRLPRRAIPHPAAPTTHLNKPVSRKAAIPSPFTLTPAEAMECFAEEAFAFELH